MISGGLLLLFIIIGFMNQDLVTNIVNSPFAFAVKYFGGLYQLILLGTFFIALYLSFSKYGQIKLGKLKRPEIGTFEWISDILCTFIELCGIFWDVADALSHSIDTPSYFSGTEEKTAEAVVPALATSSVDWGFLAWAILGTLGTIVLMYAHYHKGAPLKPRTLLYPFFGNKVMEKSVLGT